MKRKGIDINDKELIGRYENGDEHAFETLYYRYREPLFSYLNKLLPRQTSTVDDLYQQTWKKIIAALSRYQEHQKFLSWAIRIAHNVAIDYFRKNQKEILTDKEDMFERPSYKNMPWQNLSKAELMEAVEQALQEISSDQREVFIMRQQGIAFKEIADIQDVGINTVLGRMRYAVDKLQLFLSEWKNSA